ITLVNKYTLLEQQINPADIKDIRDFKTKIDLDFLESDIGDLIKSCMEGVERTKNIILDLKNFSRMDEMVFSECNIPKEIDTTLNILNNKLKNRITVHKEYEENLPKIEAYGGQINQVFMNIIDNAQGAIKGSGDIYIRAKKEGENISIQFEDTGCGIKQEDINKIFEPFFTTKPVGQGTGLGMSIAYRVIEGHNGKIMVESEVGKGTKITIILPIEHKEAAGEVKNG
ncbi:MAG: ATP-binding protein, partial [Candidatus Gastranaerophilales bacterium]|nr:ATP-binding protein [Candidatus Gastranaerophilales bacterium]